MIPAAALAVVPGVAVGAALRITPLAGGIVNRSFRVATSTGEYVVRLNGPAQEALELGVDRGFELSAQRLAAAAGLAPRVLAAAPDHSWQVSEYVAGEVPDARMLATPRVVARLGTTLRRLRMLDIDRVGPRGDGAAAEARALPRAASLLERAHRLAAQATRRLPDEAGDIAALLALAEQGWRASGAGRGSRRDACLVHSDPNAGNVVLVPGEGPALLIDWEYAHVGDPLQDPAAWLQACPALRGREAELLRACGLAPDIDAAMLVGMAQVYESIGLLWARLAETAAGIPPGGRAN